MVAVSSMLAIPGWRVSTTAQLFWQRRRFPERARGRRDDPKGRAPLGLPYTLARGAARANPRECVGDTTEFVAQERAAGSLRQLRPSQDGVGVVRLHLSVL